MSATLTLPKQRSPITIGSISLHRFTVDQFIRMWEEGYFSVDARLELINGYIVEKPMQSPAHIDVLMQLFTELVQSVPKEWLVFSQVTVQFNGSIPEPDLTIVFGPKERYRGRHARPEDIGIVLEVSDSSYDFDSVAKLAMYAQNNIPIYWIVNIPARQVEVYTQPLPTEERYTMQTVYAIGQHIPLIVDGQTIATFAVADIIPEGSA